MKKLTVLGIIGGAALLTAVPLSLQWSQTNVALSLDSADARVGRPLTPLSVAGVHRRAYRRTARSAVYAGAAAAGYGVYSGYRYPSYYSSYAPQSYYGGYGYPGYSTAPYNPGPSYGFGWRY
jgi:hypothetical protein